MKKRIAYIVTTYPCRSETFIHNEISLLRDMGLDIVVFAAKSERTETSVEEKAVYRMNAFSSSNVLCVFKMIFCWPMAMIRIVNNIFRYMFVEPYEALSLLKNFSRICYCACMLKKLKVSHIHGTFLSWPGRIAYILSKATALPYSLAVHARDGYVEPGALKLKIAQAQFVICCSNAMAEHIKSQVPLADRKKVRVVYHGVSAQLTKPLSDIHFENRTFTAVGRFVRKKGFDHLMMVFKDLIEEYKDITLMLIGDGPEKKRIVELIEDFGLENRVVLTGWLSHSETLVQMSRSYSLIVPSVISSDNDRDGIPNVILEAFMLKVPVIASGIHSIRESIVNGENGLLYMVGDDEQLKERMICLLNDIGLRDEIIQNAYDVCTRKFNSQTNIKNIYSLFCSEVI